MLYFSVHNLHACNVRSIEDIPFQRVCPTPDNAKLIYEICTLYNQTPKMTTIACCPHF